ncbi:MAG TPA: bifunctional polysaccharide deacetylase/glycosyltransferase family 2 protein [Streptosporangiaceae bacterium]|nr:bifunctional polysaccharide deacetylase/glycosyltransferase family 2 protein [Streptosporangiaceae bacterium]
MRNEPVARAAQRRHRKTPPPRGHWAFVGLVLLVCATGLFVEGYTHGVLGETIQAASQAGSSGPPGPASLLNDNRPVISATGRRPSSYSMPPRTAALTFDDGPDPTWTPKILAILARYHVPATFFTVGAHVASYPALVRAELRAGDEIGSHTYTHLNLAAAGWREPVELTLTQNALAGAAGIRTNLLRPPYCGGPDALTAADWRAYQRAARFGYLIVLDSVDTRDWARPGVARIVAAAMPHGTRGAIIMMHDSGGDRSQTVRALPQIITRLRARGYRFVTVTAGLHLPAADLPATTSQRIIGLALVITQQAADHAVQVLAAGLLIASCLMVIRLLMVMCFAGQHRRRRRSPPDWPSGQPAPGVSVIVPAYNEAAGIAATVLSMVASSYPGDIEIVVVDDGSTDDTAAIVRNLRLPGVRLISQPNAGKPAALNRGIAEARHDNLILVDGDTVFDPAAVSRLTSRLAGQAVGAVSGNTKVANRRGMLGRWQHLEYVMGFNLDRAMFDILGAIPTVPGAIGAFRRAALAAVGGLSADTLAEDTDLTLAVCRSGWRVVYEQSAIAWTEAPSTLRQLWRQRYRWCYGTLQAMWKHRHSVVERGASGRVGRRCLTYLVFFQVLLPLIAPVVDLATIYGLVFLSPLTISMFWLAFNSLQMIACGYALSLDGERIRAIWSLPLQQVVYRQLMYLVTIQSVMTALLGTRHRWQAVSRTGVFAGEPDLAAAATAPADLAR